MTDLPGPPYLPGPQPHLLVLVQKPPGGYPTDLEPFLRPGRPLEQKATDLVNTAAELGIVVDIMFDLHPEAKKKNKARRGAILRGAKKALRKAGVDR